MIAQAGESFVNQWFNGYWLVLITKAAIVLGSFALLIGIRMIVDCGRSAAVARLAVQQSGNCTA